MECVRTIRWVDPDSPWAPATGGAVASCAEADHSEPRVEGSLEERCAQHVEDSKQVAEPRGSSGVIGPGGHRHEGGARSGVDACQGTIETQTSSVHESRCCYRGSEVEGHQVGEGSGSIGEFRGRGGFFAGFLPKRPLEVQIKECREFISRAEHRVAKLEADVVAEKTMLEEGRARLSRLEQQSQGPPPVPTKSGGRVGATNHRFGTGARCIPSCCHPNEEEKSSDPQTSTEFARSIRCVDDTRCQTPCRTSRGGRFVARGCTKFGRMVIDRQCNLRDATEFGDLPSVGVIRVG